MNFTASSVLKVRASSRASLITTAGGVSPVSLIAHELAHRHAENQAIDNRHAFRPPILRRVGNQRIDLGDPSDRVRRE